jgi:thymidylate kinase
LIVEFAGVPKSGKSSSIGVVRDYFSRNGYNVRLMAEGARICPLSRQHRVEYACWAANQVLNSILESRYGGLTETLVLQDRGLFDALAFLKLLHLEERISGEELTDCLGYLVSTRWTRLVDLVLLFKVSPERAIERDAAAKLGARSSFITNTATMRKLSLAYDFILEQYGDRFVKVERVDTTDIGTLETARRVIQIIQECLKSGSVTHWGQE